MFDRRQSYLAKEIEKAAGLYEPPMHPEGDAMGRLHHMYHLMQKTPYDKCQYCREEDSDA